MDLLLLSTILWLVIRLGIFAWLHIKYREFDTLKNTVSDYGTSKSRTAYSAMGILSTVAYTMLLVYLLKIAYEPAWLLYVLGASILGSVAILFFPTDRTGAQATTTGMIHWGLACFNFGTIFVFMVNATVPHLAALPPILDSMTWIVRITFYAFLASLLLPKLRQSVMGLCERLFLTATPLWFIVFAWMLLTIA